MTYICVDLLSSTQSPEKSDITSEIARSEQLITALSSVTSVFSIELVSAYNQKQLKVYIAVPRERVYVCKEQIKSIFVEAGVEECGTYTAFSDDAQIHYGHLVQKKHFALPIRTYKKTNTDTFLTILGTLSDRSKENTTILLQILVKKSESHKKDAMHRIHKRIADGFSFEKAIKNEGFLHSLFLGGKKKEGDGKEVSTTSKDDHLISLLQEKEEHPLLDVNMRVAVGTEDGVLGESIFEEIKNSYKQFSGTSHNEIILKKEKKMGKGMLSKIAFRIWDEKETVVLSEEELVSLFRLPTGIDTTKSQNIALSTDRVVPPPTTNMPDSGLFLGQNVYKGVQRKIYIPHEDRVRHMYIVGGIGVGKSTLVKTLAAQDIYEGRGVAVLDPNGDMILELLQHVPKERLDDVMLIDPGELEFPIAINMLEYNRSHPEEKSAIINNMISIFQRLYSAESQGAFFEYYLRYTLQLLMEATDKEEPATLSEVPRVLVDEEFRKRKLQTISDPQLLNFWEKEVPAASNEGGGDFSLAQVTPWFVSKFNAFIADEYMRPIIGQPYSSYNFNDIINNKKIIFVRLSKGKISELNAKLLGMLVTNKITLATFARENIPENERVPFYLYIDEFQNFVTDEMKTVLSEARKYRLNLIIAHQYIEQIPEEIRDAVLSNVGTFVTFRVGPSTAKKLNDFYAPIITEKDLISVKNFRAAVRPLIHQVPRESFTLDMWNLKPGNKEWGEYVRERTLKKYGRDRATVEQNIKRILSE